MSYEWLIAKRYIWSQRRHPFVGVISTISVLGICVGVAALVMVLAVMNGFDEDLKKRIIGMRAHLVVEKEGLFNRVEDVLGVGEQMPEVKGASSFIEGQALIKNEDFVTGVLVRGVDIEREKTVSKLNEYMKEGSLSAHSQGVVVGLELSKKLGLSLGSKISLFSQVAEKPVPFVVEGVFSSGMYEYDMNLIFLNIKNAQNLFKMENAVTGVSIFLNDAQKAPSVKKALQKKLQYPYYVSTWMDQNKTLFGALKLEKLAMFLILALIVVVACLNIAGSLTMLVMDKTKDIGILKSLGATKLSLVTIFAMDGLLLGVVGAGAGFLVGMAGCFFLKNYRIAELAKEIYFGIDRLPIAINFWDIAGILAVAVLLSFFSSLYPAFMAARLDTIKALHYE